MMHMLGINQLDMAAPARALEAVGDPPDIEVVLVLDVSGSMQMMTSNGLDRISNLRIAARDLVEELFDDVEPDVRHRITRGAFEELFPHVSAPPS